MVVKSIHHKSTEKIAKVLAEVLDAKIKTSQQLDPSELQKSSLIGFGSGICADKHHKVILNLADNLPQVTNKKAFIFSTTGTPFSFFEKFGETMKEEVALLFMITFNPRILFVSKLPAY